MAAESPRTWTLTADASGAARWGNPRIGGVNPPLIEAGEKINVVELDWVLDLLELLWDSTACKYVSSGPAQERCARHGYDQPCPHEQIFDLLREHGRLGGSDGSQC